MRLDEYASYDGLGLAALVRSGEVESSEIVSLALDAIAAVDPVLGAVVQSYPERVEQAASRTVTGGPFEGVPTILKDLFHGETGWECGNGSRLYPQWRIPGQDEFTARLHRGGLVPMARSTTSEFGLLGTTETLAAGRTCSPWDRSVMAGGSSGGAGAVVGAGIVPIAGASDGGGSIRIPASACGVVGLKPSRGRIPWGPDVGEVLLGWAVHFVTTRTVRDTAAALDLLAGPMPGDPFEIAPPSGSFLSEVGAPVQRLRVAYWTQPWSGLPVDPEVAAATEKTAELLAELGHEVTQDSPAFDWPRFMQAMTDVWAVTNAHTIDGFASAFSRPLDDSTLEGPTLALIEHGRRISGNRLLECLDVVNTISRAMGRFFAAHDVLLTPTLAALPSPLGRYDPRAATPPWELFTGWSDLEAFLPVFNATGHPAISLPLHQSHGGLPIGMHMVGRFGSEALLLRLAASLEEALPWSGRIPPVHVSRPLPVGTV